SAQAMNWREAWNPDRVAVYCSNPTQQSKVIRLFHDDIFKTTPAIGGKKPGDDHPTSTSSVWHRMLPGEGNQFLEIVTVFRGDLLAWECGSVSQLDRFIHNLQAEGLDLAWGNDPKSWLSVGRYRKQV
ncbi:MAG TPA: hypothetical protein VL134_14550, partial [Leptolyngbya sp.]|nr:hypothetical protein [Leptolyngbya sp.]